MRVLAGARDCNPKGRQYFRGQYFQCRWQVPHWIDERQLKGEGGALSFCIMFSCWV